MFKDSARPDWSFIDANSSQQLGSVWLSLLIIIRPVLRAWTCVSLRSDECLASTVKRARKRLFLFSYRQSYFSYA